MLSHFSSTPRTLPSSSTTDNNETALGVGLLEADNFLRSLDKANLLETLLNNPDNLPPAVLHKLGSLSAEAKNLIFESLSLQHSLTQSQLLSSLAKFPAKKTIETQLSPKRDDSPKCTLSTLSSRISKIRNRISYLSSMSDSTTKKIEKIEKKRQLIVEQKIEKLVRREEVSLERRKRKVENKGIVRKTKEMKIIKDARVREASLEKIKVGDEGRKEREVTQELLKRMREFRVKAKQNKVLEMKVDAKRKERKSKNNSILNNSVRKSNDGKKEMAEREARRMAKKIQILEQEEKRILMNYNKTLQQKNEAVIGFSELMDRRIGAEDITELLMTGRTEYSIQSKNKPIKTASSNKKGIKRKNTDTSKGSIYQNYEKERLTPLRKKRSKADCFYMGIPSSLTGSFAHQSRKSSKSKLLKSNQIFATSKDYYSPASVNSKGSLKQENAISRKDLLNKIQGKIADLRKPGSEKEVDLYNSPRRSRSKSCSSRQDASQEKEHTRVRDSSIDSINNLLEKVEINLMGYSDIELVEKRVISDFNCYNDEYEDDEEEADENSYRQNKIVISNSDLQNDTNSPKSEISEIENEVKSDLLHITKDNLSHVSPEKKILEFNFEFNIEE